MFFLLEFALHVPCGGLSQLLCLRVAVRRVSIKKAAKLGAYRQSSKKGNITESLTPLTLKPTLYLYVNNPFAAQENLDNPVTNGFSAEYYRLGG